jgi:hypothetical protein
VNVPTGGRQTIGTFYTVPNVPGNYGTDGVVSFTHVTATVRFHNSDVAVTYANPIGTEFEVQFVPTSGPTVSVNPAATSATGLSSEQFTVLAVVVDGFNFSHDSTFSPIAFDLDIVHREKTRIHTEDNFYSKLFHIYKLHGSTNWYKSGEKIQRRREDEKDSVMIFPHRDKFKESYEMPFFELVSRFQNCLRKTNTVLFIIGYGFGDEHINRIIKEAVIANLNLQVFVISPTAAMKGKSLDFQKLIEEKGSQNIAFISSNFNDFANNMPSINSEDETKKETPLAIIQGMEPEEISETLEDYDSIL